MTEADPVATAPAPVEAEEIRHWQGVTEGATVHVRPEGATHCSPAVVLHHLGGGTARLLIHGDTADERLTLAWANNAADHGWHWPEPILPEFGRRPAAAAS